MNTLFKPEEISTLCLGIQGENKAKIIQIDVSDWLNEYPTAIINILVTRPNETTPYIANTSVSNGVFSWLITDSDTTYSGIGRAELRATQGDIIKKSLTYVTSIKESLEGVPSPLPPEPAQSWVNTVIAKANEVLDSRVESFEINAEGHLIATLEDGTTQDLGNISGVSSVNGQTGVVTLSAEDVGALPADTTIPSKTSDLTNDSGFITNAVNNLVNYYLKSETDTKLSQAISKQILLGSFSEYIQSEHRFRGDVEPPLVEVVTIFKPYGISWSSYFYNYNENRGISNGDMVITADGGLYAISNVSSDIISMQFRKSLTAVDQGYLSTSAYPQSGVAVAEAVSSKEDISNKVTSLSSSSTDTQYPSAKCVYDNLQNKLSEPSSDLAVGKYFRIASIDADGHAVLECVDVPIFTPSIINGGATLPTTSTQASYIGQRYHCIPASHEDLWFECVDITNNVYTWRRIYLEQTQHGIVLGNSKNVPYGNIAIGNSQAVSAGTPGRSSIEIGWAAHSGSQNGIVIGSMACVGNNAANAIQLGTGNNNAQETLQVRDYRLLEADGTIPPERITSQNWTDAQRLAVLLSLGCTVDENGFVKWTATPSK